MSGEPPDWLADLADNPRGTVPKADHWGIPATLAISIIVIFGLESLFQARRDAVVWLSCGCE